jgi:ribonuclease Y
LPVTFALFLGILIGAGVVVVVVRLRASSLRVRREELLAAARRDADQLRIETETRLREEELARRRELDQRDERMRDERQQEERRLARRDADLERREGAVDARERAIERRDERVAEREGDLEAERAEQRKLMLAAKDELLRIAGMDREQAVAAALERFAAEIDEEAASRLRKLEERVDGEVEMRAQKVLAHAIQRLAIPYVNDAATTSVALQDEEMKGRIIGREGRNVRTFEQAAGVDLVIDDTPGVVVVSSFDNVRREVARRALERLVEDGRIHPARIEDVVAKTRREIDDDIRQTARKVLHELEVPRVDPRLAYCLGRLKYRTSYGQNQLKHAIEVAWLAAALAGEMGLDPRLARRCGLFHDIGKSLDHALDGGHPALGADLLRRCGERDEVVNAAAAHHDDVAKESTYALLAQVADAISAARPGARRDNLDRYIERLEKLERLAREFDGVEAAYALQAGHELRVMVDAGRVDDARALLLARQIAKRIESELSHPGEIKVTVLRETRVVEYAR